MKFFNIDLHISVIEDVARIFRRLGHEVTSVNMSGHSWVFGRQPAPAFGPVTRETWQNVSADQFFEACKNQLADFDGFIVTYPPALSQIYERFNKPIILQIAIRYEYPYHNDPQKWQQFNAFIKRMHEKGLLYVAANCLYDCEYFECFTGIKPRYIQNFCSYPGVRYHPDLDTILQMECRTPEVIALCKQADPAIQSVRELYKRYEYSDIVRHKAFIHIPYNCSIMSFFEHYTMCVPIFVPTPRFMIELHKAYGILRELTWNGVFGTSAKSIIDRVKVDLPDPNEFTNLDSLAAWIKYFDYFNFEHVTYFDSFNDLREKIHSCDFDRISQKMAIFNAARLYSIDMGWMKILKEIHD